MSEVIVVTSGKGGVGKTTTSANIGCGLALEGKKVVLVDSDIGLRNLDVVMGLENRIVYDLVDVIEGTCRLKQALIKDKRYQGLFLLPAAQTRDKNAVSPEQMKKLCQNIKDMGFEYIIIDCPAGIEQGFKNAVAGADRAVVVTTPEVSAVRDADRIIGLLEANGISNPGLIVNRLRVDMVKRGDMMSVDDVKEILSVDVLGVVPDDEDVVITTNKGEPAVTEENSRAGRAYRNITLRLMGEEVPFMGSFRKRRIFRKTQKNIRALIYCSVKDVDVMDILGLLKNNNAKSGGVAKDRLKLVLVHDRVGCSYTVLEMLKADILNVISEYMEIDDEELDIRLTHIKETSGEVPVLYANIPIRSMRMAKSG